MNTTSKILFRLLFISLSIILIESCDDNPSKPKIDVEVIDTIFTQNPLIINFLSDTLKPNTQEIIVARYIHEYHDSLELILNNETIPIDSINYEQNDTTSTLFVTIPNNYRGGVFKLMLNEEEIYSINTTYITISLSELKIDEIEIIKNYSCDNSFALYHKYFDELQDYIKLKHSWSEGSYWSGDNYYIPTLDDHPFTVSNDTLYFSISKSSNSSIYWSYVYIDFDDYFEFLDKFRWGSHYVNGYNVKGETKHVSIYRFYNNDNLKLYVNKEETPILEYSMSNDYIYNEDPQRPNPQIVTSSGSIKFNYSNRIDNIKVVNDCNESEIDVYYELIDTVDITGKNFIKTPLEYSSEDTTNIEEVFIQKINDFNINQRNHYKSYDNNSSSGRYYSIDEMSMNFSLNGNILEKF